MTSRFYLLCIVALCATTAVASVAADPPRTLVLRPEALADARARLDRSDPALQSALDRLLAEAEEALTAGPFSVMEKTFVPPSGDRHDYHSLGPYWWPNPDTPDGLPYVRRDGERNPESRGPKSDSGRLAALRTAVETLALAYSFTDDARYAEHAAHLLRVWFIDPETRMNPNLRYGQAIPGRSEGRGIGIIETVRLIVLLDAVRLLEPSSAWTPADARGFAAWAEAYLDWLLTSPHGIDEANEHNNHGIWYDAQVAALALFVGKEGVARAVIRGSRDRRLPTHVTSDGRQPHELARTRAFSYSVYNLTAWFTLARLGEHVGVDVWTAEPDGAGGLRAAIDFLAPFADPARPWPYPQITPLDRTDLIPLLLEAAHVYGDPAYAAWIDRMPDADRVRADRAHLLHPGPANR